ncbi:MAG TPA: hypothetical protein VJP02_24425 [Candidatus Sulfotelmatobacter sp.]|nr:hypothetical protein [Candidatus Sulfotelmatobacter sp.]
MDQRRWNRPLWVGFLVCVVAFVSYPVFARFPVTRDVPWVNFLLFGMGFGFLVLGLWRAFRQSEHYRGKAVGSILGTVCLLGISFFCFLIFYYTRQLPPSTGAPHVGHNAPEFVLSDTNNQQLSLASILSTPIASTKAPPKGVVLVFYRGYW